MVHVCVRAEQPLAPALRARLARLAHEHGLLDGDVQVVVAEPPRLSSWERVKTVFGWRFPDGFVDSGLHAEAGTWECRRGVRVLKRALAGPWISDAVADQPGTASLIIASSAPRWAGEPLRAGSAAYLAVAHPVVVRIDSAYRKPSRFDPPNGELGAVCDILTVNSHGELDGRRVARSKLVQELKRQLGLEIICRASWY